MLYPYDKLGTPRREQNISSVGPESGDERASEIRAP